MQFKCLNICSHTLAAARINDDVDGFHKKFGNRLPNLTQLASHGMPANAGRKVGKAPRKKTTRSVITSENRIPLQSIHVVNKSTADNETTQSHCGVSSCISPPYSLLPLFPVPSPPPCMYSHYPNASHHFPIVNYCIINMLVLDMLLYKLLHRFFVF